MIKKFALYPFAAKTTDFKVGDSVQQLITDHYGSVFVGTVIAVRPSVDKVDVQWPHQIGSHSPEDLLPVSEALGIRPTVVDLMVPASTAKGVAAIGGVPSAVQVQVVQAHLKKVAKLMKDALILRADGHNEVSNFTKVSSAYGDALSDDQVRLIVSSLYNKDKARRNAVYLSVIYDLIDA